jgi:hypothetical protein
MVANTMIPEAFDDAGVLAGLVTALGFLLAYTIHDLSG